MRGALFGDQVEGFNDAIVYNGEYVISNAPIKLIAEEWKSNSGIVLYVEDKLRIINTSQGQEFRVKEVQTDHTNTQPLTVIAWNDLAGIACDALSAYNVLQEERHWLQERIYEPDLENVIAYIGCSNCGRRTDFLVGTEFTCAGCKKASISSYRVTFEFEVVDDPGEITFTTLNNDTEKLFGKITHEIHVIKLYRIVITTKSKKNEEIDSAKQEKCVANVHLPSSSKTYEHNNTANDESTYHAMHSSKINPVDTYIALVCVAKEFSPVSPALYVEKPFEITDNVCNIESAEHVAQTGPIRKKDYGEGNSIGNRRSDTNDSTFYQTLLFCDEKASDSSLSTRMYSRIINNLKGDRANMREWSRLYTQMLLDRQSRILQVRYLNNEETTVTIQYLKDKKCGKPTHLQEGRHFLVQNDILGKLLLVSGRFPFFHYYIPAIQFQSFLSESWPLTSIDCKQQTSWTLEAVHIPTDQNAVLRKYSAHILNNDNVILHMLKEEVTVSTTVHSCSIAELVEHDKSEQPNEAHIE
uniref:Replication factor A C-terminal domain-containing protein n=1 Tax=Chenopodium quinoa TaxID=63459 RepID=A0A803MQK5_CHEQI